MPTFTLRLHLKTNKSQYCLRSLPGEFDELVRHLPDLSRSVTAQEKKKWSHGPVSVSWNMTPQYKSTLSFYPAAGYLELNVNKGSPLCNSAEQWEAKGQLPTFRATYSDPTGAAECPTVNLSKI